jgi:hypothetical protein
LAYFITDIPREHIVDIAASSIVQAPRIAVEMETETVRLAIQNIAWREPVRDLSQLPFSNSVVLYINERLSNEEVAGLHNLAREHTINLTVRDTHWLETTVSRPVAFLSHDSRDKGTVARPLAQALARLLVPVWYDEYSLQVGDSLRDSIDKGLLECRRAIVILSKNFMSNKGWSRAEFNGIWSRHMDEGAFMLPVWHKVRKAQVAQYSLMVSDIVALKTSEGIPSIAAKLAVKLREASQPGELP